MKMPPFASTMLGSLNHNAAKRISRKQRQASWLTSSRPASFFSNGCFSGSLEYFQSSSDLRFLAVDRVLVRVLFGGAL